MSEDNVDLIRTAYDAYLHGDLATILELVDPELEWSYLDPSLADPEPQVCHGRHELRVALERQLKRGLPAKLEEVVGQGDQVMVVIHIPGIDAHRARPADDRNYDVFTIRAGRIVAIHACRDRADALAVAGIG
jgi:ketosteroid isomerase-like protein